VKIEEQREGHFPPPRPVMMAAREMQAAGEPPLSPGQIEIRSTVTLTASIR
jgi:uncharacterized protein YggE